ncbi:hypothetical protein ACQP3F_26290, partial [Escherichia coli]
LGYSLGYIGKHYIVTSFTSKIDPILLQKENPEPVSNHTQLHSRGRGREISVSSKPTCSTWYLHQQRNPVSENRKQIKNQRKKMNAKRKEISTLYFFIFSSSLIAS